MIKSQMSLHPEVKNLDRQANRHSRLLENLDYKIKILKYFHRNCNLLFAILRNRLNKTRMTTSKISRTLKMIQILLIYRIVL